MQPLMMIVAALIASPIVTFVYLKKLNKHAKEHADEYL